MRAALIPIRSLPQAKMRLAGVLDRQARYELALAMLRDVVTACTDSGRFDLVAVISDDAEARWTARDLGAKPLAEPATLNGLNASLTFGLRYLERRVGADEAVVLPADVPLATADDIRTVVDSFIVSGGVVTLVRARDGGTNALALRPPTVLPMRFGPASADAHVLAAREAGVTARELRIDRLAFDVDTPDDLALLDGLQPGAATSAWLAAWRHRAG